MKRFTYLLFVPLVACAAGDDGEYPIHPQSTPAPPTGSSESQTISGRVCIADDLRSPSTCGTGIAGGLIVTSGENATTTDAAGNFTIDTSATDPSITVSGSGIVPTSTTPVRGNTTLQTIIPAIDAAMLDSAIAAIGVSPEPGTGAILASVTSNGSPAVGATVTTNPVSPFGPFFDGDTPVNWGIDGTGQRGVVLIPGLTAGMVDLTFADALGGLTTLVAGVPVRNGGVTILDTEFTTNF